MSPLRLPLRLPLRFTRREPLGLDLERRPRALHPSSVLDAHCFRSCLLVKDTLSSPAPSCSAS